MNWKRIICWLLGHKFKIPGDTLADILTATTRTCTRCDLTEPHEIGQLIPDIFFAKFAPIPMPLSTMFPPPPEKEEEE